MPMVRIGDLFDSKVGWEKACLICGLNEWGINEGLFTKEDTTHLTADEFKQIFGLTVEE